jgi:hypothetical protein
MAGERQAEKPDVAFFATKRPEEKDGQDSLFQETFTPRWMDSLTAALWTLHDGNSPDAKLKSQITAQFSPAEECRVCPILDSET